MEAASLIDLQPLARLALLGVVLALGPLAWVWSRHRGGDRRHALTLLILFLTFDLVLFGAFTRLTDSGLGCPDWPGCYGNASPLGAQAEIQAAESARPGGPVTHRKAWIEMLHRYLATGVGVLIMVMTALAWRQWRVAGRAPGQTGGAARRTAPFTSPWWATATLVWVCIQGAFGAWTVTLQLYPAIVTAHLLGGLVLLVLLGLQAWGGRREPVPVSPGLRLGIAAVALLTALQIALGAWVSTNYAVLACTDFPTCHGRWWPEMDFRQGFTLLRELGAGADGGWLPFAALTAIHMAHRLGAAVLLGALALLAWRLARRPGLRRHAVALAAIGLWQLASGVSNVVLGWPLAAALGHTAGAAALVLLLTALSVHTAAARPAAVAGASRAPRGIPARGTT